jgi:hypothetical protein
MRPSRSRRLLGALGAGVLALTIAPTVAAAPSSAYQLDLGTRADYVGQTNLVQCVGASMQMMLNMMSSRDDRSAATQLRLQRLGWARGLTMEGGGPYQVVGKDTVQEALLAAARAMRTTGRPVGLLVWRGRHAWVMSGFRATKDPLLTGARVTAAIVEDPLNPFGDSTTWGRSPRPGEALSISELSTQFVRRRQSSLSPSLSGKFVVVLPFEIDQRTLRLHGFLPSTVRG